MATHAIDTEKLGRLARVGHFLLHEFRQMLPPTVFFFIGFNLILFTGGGAVGRGGFIEEQLGGFSWHRFIATQMWIFVLFLVYVTANEINQLLGDGELFKIFFMRRSSQLKSTRRQRIRLLVRLSRLTEANSLETLRDRASAPHAELVGILKNLGPQDPSE
jgi:hypothetical protein